MKEIPTEPTSLTSVQKAFSILEFLAGQQEPASLARVAQRCMISKPSAVRLLHTLHQLGYVERPENSRDYQLGPKLSLLAGGEKHDDWKRHARPALVRLHERLNETVNLGILLGSNVVYLDYLETTRPLRMIVAPGTSEPWEKTAIGRAIVSGFAEAEQKHFLDGWKAGATAKKAMIAKLREFTRRGYAEETGESVEGAGCVAVSLAPTGLSRAAISVAAPVQRLKPARRQEIVHELMGAVKSLPPFPLSRNL